MTSCFILHNIPSQQDLSADSPVEAVVFPGGFGAAKNLCTFAVSSDPEADPEAARVLREFRAAGKPVGMCCIAPVLAGIVLAKEDGVKVKVTLGEKGEVEMPMSCSSLFPFLLLQKL